MHEQDRRAFTLVDVVDTQRIDLCVVRLEPETREILETRLWCAEDFHETTVTNLR